MSLQLQPSKVCNPSAFSSAVRIEEDGDDSDLESILSLEDEDEMIKSMVREAFSGRISNNDLKRFLQDDNDDFIEGRCSKRARTISFHETSDCRMVQTVSNEQMQHLWDAAATNGIDIKPEQMLSTLLEESIDSIMFPSSTLPNFFVSPNDESTNGYDADYLRAVLANDVPKLRQMMEVGHCMQCANRFGETVLHIACRRSLLDVLNFLIYEANVSIRVRCDNGRTPLHEACWTAKPNWHIINLILDVCPDLLYITDNNGHSPLAYIPKELWGVWCTYLKNRDIEGLKRREIG